MTFASLALRRFCPTIACLLMVARAMPPEVDLLCGLNHETAGEMPQATERYRAAADAGNAWAQFDYGVMLYCGKGTERDVKQAIRYWLAAAKQGHAPAKYNLALCLARGEKGVKQDYEKAVRLWTQAAEAGVSEAWSNLAICAAKGLGMEKDLAKARAYMAKVRPELNTEEPLPETPAETGEPTEEEPAGEELSEVQDESDIVLQEDDISTHNAT